MSLKYRLEGYCGDPGAGDRPQQSRQYKPLLPRGHLPPSAPHHTLAPLAEPATFHATGLTAQDVFNNLDRALAPYNRDKKLIMNQETYDGLMDTLLPCRGHHLWVDYAEEINTIYTWPKMLVEQKIARCLDPTKITNREGFHGYLQWASENHLLPANTSVASVMREFDSIHQRGSPHVRERPAEPRQRSPSVRDEVRVSKKRTKHGKAKGTSRIKRTDDDGSYRGRR